MESIYKQLKELAIKVASDFPDIETCNWPMHIWAIEQAHLGTKDANEELHAVVNILRERLGLSPDDITEVWMKMLYDKGKLK